jgi:rod shape-determining protein MreC
MREASNMEMATQGTVTPLVNIFAGPLRSVEGFFGSLSDRAQALKENRRLQEELVILRDKQSRYENLANKVARYEAILGVDTETDVPLKKIAARAVGEIDGPFVRSLLLNVGSNDDVITGNPVMSVEGLVGHVINVGPRSSRVLRLSDLNSRIAVASARSDATAILAGDNSPDPKLSFINQPENWAEGDSVITSGDDGALPRGLAIGEVIVDEAGEMRVVLSSRRAAIDWVWVSPYKRIAPPLENEAEVAP